MNKQTEIKFIANAIKWFDKINGNTYHSVRITRVKDSTIIVVPFGYGYGNQYQQSALSAMLKAGWIDSKYQDKPYLFERENNYPIYWNCTDGLKRDCVANGVLQ